MKCDFTSNLSKSAWKERKTQCDKILDLLYKYITKYHYDCSIKTQKSLLDKVSDEIEIDIRDESKLLIGSIGYTNYSNTIYIDHVNSNVTGIGLGNLLICLALCLDPEPALEKEVTLRAVASSVAIESLMERKKAEPEQEQILPEFLFRYYESLGFQPTSEIEGQLPMVYQDFSATTEDLLEIGCAENLFKKMHTVYKD